MKYVTNNEVTVVARRTSFHKALTARRQKLVQNGAKRISAEDAARKIVQRFGSSLAVLAD